MMIQCGSFFCSCEVLHFVRFHLPTNVFEVKTLKFFFTDFIKQFLDPARIFSRLNKLHWKLACSLFFHTLLARIEQLLSSFPYVSLHLCISATNINPVAIGLLTESVPKQFASLPSCLSPRFLDFTHLNWTSVHNWGSIVYIAWPRSVSYVSLGTSDCGTYHRWRTSAQGEKEQEDISHSSVESNCYWTVSLSLSR